MKTKEIIKQENINHTYNEIRSYIINSKNNIYRAINSEIVLTYWKIGKKIYEACGENERAAYGKRILEEISKRLTAEFGKGFDVTNLRKMRQFYLIFPIQDALRLELSWTHYRLLMRVESNAARQFYIDECINGSWSTRWLERQINTMYYQRIWSQYSFLKIDNQ